MSRYLAIIPARGNSTRLPGKNIRLIAGKPSIVHTIDHLNASSLSCTIAAISDDPQTLDIAEQAGALAIQGPADLMEQDNLYAVYDWAAKNVAGGPWELLIEATANSPVRPPGMFDQIVAKQRATGCDMVIPVCRVEPSHNPMFYCKLSKSDELVFMALNLIGNSQDFRPLYGFAGIGRVMTPQAAEAAAINVVAAENVWDIRGVAFESHECVDVDTELDAQWAEFLLSREMRNGELCSRE